MAKWSLWQKVFAELLIHGVKNLKEPWYIIYQEQRRPSELSSVASYYIQEHMAIVLKNETYYKVFQGVVKLRIYY